MRVAFFSPLPPSRSGIADYSAALLSALKPMAETGEFTGEQRFDPAAWDVALYQIGNNDCHAFAYEQALRHPGIVVLHEANLHHLLAGITIRQGDWDRYLREVAYDGGPAALEFAQRVRRLEVGPDYHGVPMLRRLLGRSKGIIVHSRYMARQVRDAGFSGPLAVIPHGVWFPQVDGYGARRRLGLDGETPLAGTFGYLKPYKRLGEGLRAFRRLAKLDSRVRLILGGEPHPDFPLDGLIDSLDLREKVRVLGYVPPEELPEYIAACDVVLNLRFPTVGETSGSLMRSLGLGRPVLVSDIAAFSEFPDDVCLKVPVGEGEEETIFEYLQLLVERPSLAKALGSNAKDWAARHCSWERAAEQYLAFLKAVANGLPWEESAVGLQAAASPATAPRASGATLPAGPPQGEELAVYLRSWTSDDAGARDYLEKHLARLVRTLEITPQGTADDRILEMGAYMQITPALHYRLGYGEVRGCYFGPAGRVDHKEIVSRAGERFSCAIDLFNAEADPFPYPDGHFATVLCCELIEHLVRDPMFLISEIHRILRPGGRLVLTTPNISSLRAIGAILDGYHPGFYPAYLRPGAAEEGNARHSREYTPREIWLLFLAGGFTMEHLSTGPFSYDEPQAGLEWVNRLLEIHQIPRDLRGEGIYAVGRKTGEVRERYPSWLFSE